MLTVHHLRKSQSERIVWLCEELGLDYTLQCYDRDATTQLAPPDYKALHPVGTAPVIVDGDTTLGESGAIVDYIAAKYGKGRLVLLPEDPEFARYLYWLHFSNGNLQPAMGRNMILHRMQLPDGHAIQAATRARLDRSLALLDGNVAASPWLAGDSFTCADVMTVFSLTTMRLFYPLDLAPWPGILAYLQRVGERPAYRLALRKGDPELEPMLD